MNVYAGGEVQVDSPVDDARIVDRGHRHPQIKFRAAKKQLLYCILIYITF